MNEPTDHRLLGFSGFCLLISVTLWFLCPLAACCSARRSPSTASSGAVGAAELADVFRQPVGPALQPADADHAGQREESGAQWVFQARAGRAREVRGDAAGRRRRHVHGAGAQRRRRARRGDRPHVLDRTPQLSPLARVCCGRVNRGVAILGDTLFMGTIDGHLIAIDAKTGRPVWDKAVVDPAGGRLFVHRWRRSSSRTRSSSARRAASTASAGSSPRSSRDRQRGLAVQHDSWTGRDRATKPGPSRLPGRPAAAPSWVTGSYDPELESDLLGHRQSRSRLERRSAARRQPLHRFGDRARRRHRPVEVALPVHAARRVRLRRHAGAGARRHDVAGPARKVMLWANRNGFLYVLDRTTGQFLQGKPFTKVNWADGFDEKGRPKRVLNRRPPKARSSTPNNQGGDQLVLAVVQPAHRPVLHPELDGHLLDATSRRPVEYTEGQPVRRTVPDDGVPGAADRARRDQSAAARRWIRRDSGVRSEDRRAEVGIQDDRRHRQRRAVDGVGSRCSPAAAKDTSSRSTRATGEQLWRASVGGQVSAGPMSYAVGGRQYVAIAAGSTLFVYALRQSATSKTPAVRSPHSLR